MIRSCLSRNFRFSVLQRWRGRTGRCQTRRGAYLGVCKYATAADSAKYEKKSIIYRQYEVFKRLQYPAFEERKDPAVWTALLEPSLPPHLRRNGSSQEDANLETHDIAEIILAAQRFLVPIQGIDLLFHLGIVEGRWSAVVWIVKRLVETFGGPYLRSRDVSHTIIPWKNEESLDSLTEHSISYETLARSAHKTRGPLIESYSLDALTEDIQERLSQRGNLRRDALGQIWRSLGNMTIACADSEIKPEILEIIAYLHHMGIMPMSIYNQTPSSDTTAIQQPPTLSLVSSRILTSLSDAAWRAHEKLVVEEAKAKGHKHAAIRPEISGTAYRVSVAGIRPEIWLELILWSCLHGSWVFEGGEILRTAYFEKSTPQWRPISWRSIVDSDGGGGGGADWEKLEYSFKTRAPSTTDQEDLGPTFDVQRTISSEVVNAYIDASLSTMRLGVGERGVSSGYVIEQLRILRKFLDRSGLSLSSGSWDAIVMRFFDLQGHVVDHKQQFSDLVDLSPVMGEGLTTPSEQGLPAYVLDGSAAMLGLFHQAIRSRIKAGDVKGAFELFQAVQSRADGNKRQSIVDFLHKQHRSVQSAEDPDADMFTGNFSGIDYPAFFIQIPPTILGPFLDLVADAKAYNFGQWLLYSDEVDGPIIPPRLYSDPALAPALIRFSTETNDTVLLSKLIRSHVDTAKENEPSLPRNVLQSFFESQVKLKRWDAAVRILKHMKDSSYGFWNPIALAQVAQVMLQHSQSSETNGEDYQLHFDRAKDLFANMAQGEYDRRLERSEKTREQITMLVIILSVINQEWAIFCLGLDPLNSHYSFTLPARAFNRILEGVVEAYGSAEGRRLLDLFWPVTVRHTQSTSQRISKGEVSELKMSRYMPSHLEAAERQRTEISLPAPEEHKVVIYGGLQPDLMTVRIIFRHALSGINHGKLQGEFATDVSLHVPSPSENSVEQSPSGEIDSGMKTKQSPSEVLIWSIRCLRRLHMADEDMVTELRSTLEQHGMHELRTQLSELFQKADETEEDTTPLG